MKIKNIKKNKNVFYICSVIILLILIVSVISKSFAIYSLNKQTEIFSKKIGGFTDEDILIAVIVDNQETDIFPKSKDNYLFEKVECNNNVEAEFDTLQWQIKISNITNKSKCIFYFNSKKENEIEPISKEKSEILSDINKKISDKSNELSNIIYPVGTIYMTTEYDTVTKVEAKLGGTWQKYSQGIKMVGSKDDEYILNQTGGNKSVTIKNENIPTFNISGTASSTGAGYTFTYGSSSRTTNTTGNHAHYLNNGAEVIVYNSSSPYGSLPGSGTHYGLDWVSAYTSTAGNHSHTASNCYVNSIKGVAGHNHVISLTYENSKNSEILLTNEYVLTYVYVRIK